MNQITKTNIVIFGILLILAIVNPLVAATVIVIMYAATLYDAVYEYKLIINQLKTGAGKMRMQYSKVSEPGALVLVFYWIPPFIVAMVNNQLKGNDWFFACNVVSYVLFVAAFFIMSKRNKIADSSLL